MINIQLMAAIYNFIKPMVLISTDVRNQHLAPIFSEIIVKKHVRKIFTSCYSFKKKL